MRVVGMSLMLGFQIGLSIPAGAQTAAGAAPPGEPTIVPLDRTHVLLALPQHPPRARPRPRASASPAPAARAFAILPPAASAPGCVKTREAIAMAQQRNRTCGLGEPVRTQAAFCLKQSCARPTRRRVFTQPSSIADTSSLREPADERHLRQHDALLQL